MRRRFATIGLAALAATGALAAGAASSANAQDDAPPPVVVDCDAPAPAAADTVRIATKPLEPFVFVDDEELRGFSIDYWNEVAARLGVSTEWCVKDTVGEIIDLAEAGAVDASIAGISITKERELIIDFSQPYYISGQQLVTLPGGTSTLGTLFDLLFSGTFLVPVALLIVLVLIVSHLVWFFERGHESDDFPYEYRSGIGEAIWWSTVSVITGGEAVKNINTALSRIIAVFWMLVGLFLLAFVTARATSVLTVAELESDIGGLEDLAGKSVTTVEGTASVDFLRDEAGIEPRQAATLSAALDDLVAGTHRGGDLRCTGRAVRGSDGQPRRPTRRAGRRPRPVRHRDAPGQRAGRGDQRRGDRDRPGRHPRPAPGRLVRRRLTASRRLRRCWCRRPGVELVRDVGDANDSLRATANRGQASAVASARFQRR